MGGNREWRMLDEAFPISEHLLNGGGVCSFK